MLIRTSKASMSPSSNSSQSTTIVSGRHLARNKHQGRMPPDYTLRLEPALASRLATDERIVDAYAMQFVMKPDQFDVHHHQSVRGHTLQPKRRPRHDAGRQ